MVYCYVVNERGELEVQEKKWKVINENGKRGDLNPRIPIRDIHPSHYGRIFPIDTSEEINVRFIRSLAINVRIGPVDSFHNLK
ncbi:DNA-directed RNA polymerase, subunit 2, partial [Cynara cardunculus var. scolymus]